MDVERAITQIVRINEHIRDFWGSGGSGWAPKRASDLLSKSRLDRQVALSRTLHNWHRDFDPEEADGQLILAWANLGSLVEGTMKWFLCVFADDYARDGVKLHSGRELDPDELFFVRLCDFYATKVWKDATRTEWLDWVHMVRQRRNAIHSYRDREIGTFGEFREAVIRYRRFLADIERSVPYPDEQHGYPSDIYEMIMNGA